MKDVALLLRGVYKVVLEEIVSVQEHLPEQVLYLQPYSESPIKQLADDPPTLEAPMQLYISVTNDLDTVAYRGEIVGWEDKTILSDGRRDAIERLQALFQPFEVGMVFNLTQKNLIQVRGLRRLRSSFSVTELIKMDGKPVAGNPPRPGKPVYVRPR